jgi:hypothetical protein
LKSWMVCALRIPPPTCSSVRFGDALPWPAALRSSDEFSSASDATGASARRSGVTPPPRRLPRRRERRRGPQTSDSSDLDPKTFCLLHATGIARKAISLMAAKMRCSVWTRAQSPGTMTLSLVKGWTCVSLAKRGNLGIGMQDLAWTATVACPSQICSRCTPFSATSRTSWFISFGLSSRVGGPAPAACA